MNGAYQISNLGNVKSLKRRKHKILRPALCKNGYYSVVLFYNNKGKTKFLHKLVAQAFLLNDKKHKCVNHKNGIKTDNRLENLEWCSYSENHKHAYRNNLRKPIWKGVTGEKAPKSRKIIQCDMNDNIIKIWCSLTEASKELNISISNISYCCTGKRNKVKNFKWKYYEDKE